MKSAPPTAFISHSESDKDFCIALHTALAAKGVRPILDVRDFQPGDDLIRRIFDEGIGASDCVLFVLSPGSVDRPWLRKELSVSVVQQITGRTRLIPIVMTGLTDDRVPVVLAATVWIRASADSVVEDIASQIATTMHGDRPNPELAPPPKWTQHAVAKIWGLQPIDEVVLNFICETRLSGDNPFVNADGIARFAAEQDIPEAELPGILSTLGQHGYFDKALGGLGSGTPRAVQPSQHALEQYLTSQRAEEYATIFQSVVSAIVNRGAGDIESVMAVVGGLRPIIYHVIGVLETDGDLHAIRSQGGHVAWMTKPTLQRRLRAPS